MGSKVLVLVSALFVCCGLFLADVSTVVAQTSKKSRSETMDQKRKKAADKIITRMHEDGKSQADIAAQKKANKKHFGHEGEADF